MICVFERFVYLSSLDFTVSYRCVTNFWTYSLLSFSQNTYPSIPTPFHFLLQMIPPSCDCASPTSFLIRLISLKSTPLASSSSMLKRSMVLCRSCESLGIDWGYLPLVSLRTSSWTNWAVAHEYLLATDVHFTFFFLTVSHVIQHFPLGKKKIRITADQNSWSSSTSPSLSSLPPIHWILDGDYDITFAATANNTSASRSIELA